MASTYIYRDNDATAGGGYTSTWTWSAWVKRGTLGEQGLFMNRRIDHVSNSRMRFYFSSDGRLAMEVKDSTSGDDSFFQTNKLFRDTSAWYNIVLAYDTTQSAENDRIKLWINNEEVTSWEQFNRAGSTFGMLFSSATRSMLGISTNNSNQDFMFDGSMSHVHFIYGTAYTPSAFGQYDANGVWTINTSPSVTYGSQGFFVLKDGNSVTDQSGQGNNMTIDGGTLTKTEDSPSNVFATLNPLIQLTDATLSNGNNSCAYGSSMSRAVMLGTLGMSSGKYYMEFKISSSSASPCNGSVGIINGSDNSSMGTYLNQNNSVYQGAGYQLWDGVKNINQVGTAYGATVAAGDIVGMAVDIDNKALYFHKNGSYQGSGSPTSGASKTGAIDFSSLTDNGFWFPAISDASGGATMTYQCNFGNGYFGTTAVASAGTNASGIGIFEYDVPTGYTALSTKGLNL